ncbi:MAG: chorismate synthase [Clostridia bacterium]|nr:chorismate synthase [Clostridia bacterium]
MKNTFGTSVCVTLFGESHGKYIGATLDGIAPGIEIDEAYISDSLAKRRGDADVSTSRSETDEFIIVSGAYDGKTTGTPLTVLIPNSDVKPGDYTYGTARPSHADFTGFSKYHGYEDYRGGGHFSGRLTAALVAVGAIVRRALMNKNIFVGTHILQCGEAFDRVFDRFDEDISALAGMTFPVLDSSAAESVRAEIIASREASDSIGGVLQTAVIGVPAGIGEPWFDTLEGQIAHAVFSIPAVKGVEFGAGFALGFMHGSEANDAMRMVGGRVETVTNMSGGICGGISNGMPIIFQSAFKPTPSIGKPQNTVNFINGTDADMMISGRHDPAVVCRAAPVIDAMTAIVIADVMAQRYGTDWLA